MMDFDDLDPSEAAEQRNQRRVDDLTRRVRTLESALRWYSDEANWRPYYLAGTASQHIMQPPILTDRGQRAREALQEGQV